MAWQSILVAIERSLNRSHSNPQRMPVDPFFVLSLDLFCINTLDGHFHRVNPAFIATLGHPEPDLLATNILDLLHLEDRPAAAAAIAGLAHGIPSPAGRAGFAAQMAPISGWRGTARPSRPLDWHIRSHATAPGGSRTRRLFSNPKPAAFARWKAPPTPSSRWTPTGA